MSYQVLARKWRPQDFQQMVGQAHVLRALMNALDVDADKQRLHHAYLFTGTRGVGKTTLARIFAKCLNCETGITAKPCGECRSCREIAEGRHVDLLEVDAASRTKVEDTRELLDNVQYAPTRGRFKIYLIDEVHMLSGHSFNALLKTLEEPPQHVKFLFATTDPQKLPVTILSRCLQFNLKRMSIDMISGHLANVLQQEAIGFAEPALRLLARAADGSMRDALSLTDQAIVAGGGEVRESDVQDMLGLLPHEHLISLLNALFADDGAALLATVEQMAQLTTDFITAADSLIALLHNIAVQQVVANEAADAEVKRLAQQLSPADTQLYYQMALYGKRDLPLAPDPRNGFEMLLLRMLAFRLDETDNRLAEKKKLPTKPNQPAAKPLDKSVAPSEPKPVAPVQPKEAEADLAEPPPWDEPPAALAAQAPADYVAPTLSTPAVQTPVESKPVVAPATGAMNSSQAQSILQALASAERAKPVAKPPPEPPRPQDTEPDQPSVSIPAVMPEPQAESAAEPVAVAPQTESATVTSEVPKPVAPVIEGDDNAWHGILAQLPLTGMALPLAQHCVLGSLEDERIVLQLDQSGVSLQSPNAQAQLQAALESHFGRKLQLQLDVCVVEIETPEQRIKRLAAEQQAQAEVEIANDPFVKQLQSDFAATIIPGSIRPRTASDNL